MAKIDRNKPIRRGRIYCAPFCGGECTHKAFVRATKEAKTLAKRMGPGWVARVWENLGWHYSVEKGCASIVPARRGSATGGVWKDVDYTCYFNSHKQYLGDAKSPTTALHLALKGALASTRTIQRDILKVWKP